MSNKPALPGWCVLLNRLSEEGEVEERNNEEARKEGTG